MEEFLILDMTVVTQQPSCVMLSVALRSSFKALGAFVFLALGATSYAKLFNLFGFMFGLRNGSFA